MVTTAFHKRQRFHLVLFDVFHHLQWPALLKEAGVCSVHRVG
jgi:hypothetical protein